ncbi:MAG: hypothetical protein A2Z29_02370 [Chloroflexi bacterium RBG_16_56_11]|nr:MAG: hypothetical protein A2Z29_02370 [Chloroflexi bacterium RBG_16_56_11]
MYESRYDKHFLTNLIKEIPHYTGKSIVAHDGELDADCSLGYHCVSKPMSFDFSHSHDFTEMLCFIGGNPLDITDFGAEIEFTLGGEKHVITSPAVVAIPAGLKHCPIIFRKVERPLVFLEVSLTRVYKPGRRPRKRKTTEKRSA